MQVRLSVVSDTHTGSTVGLAPAGGIPHPEGFTIEASPTSRWLWGIYQQHLEAEASAAADHDVHVLVFNGDIMDGGMHHGQVQLYHPESSVERWISEAVVDEAVRWLDPDHIVIVLGTPSHVGKMGSSEESIGKALDAKHPGTLIRPDEFRYGWHEWVAEFDGFRVNAKHHGRMGRTPRTRDSYLRMYAEDIFISHVQFGQRPPDLALRGHNHQYGDTGTFGPHRNGVRVIAGPCYQMATEYIFRRAIESPPHIGMYGVSITDGRVSDVFPQIVTPAPNLGEVWTP